ncbi:TetR/AcrR family transcriptional regulator [Runella aurantiaca]|uniref:TetR/AcrR family transcriptional regulator n=1 Tax=Runella aurantiaca TaxID=2282308 RepID=A0A369IBF0_9BACT|nr:TetR/AcrR family transcriptional regulator [Runella aurantiaca]RDB06362.1 TetR/AcrR family transcriptional regulator [Runella aurantiaca]
MVDTKTRILEKSIELFNRFGFVNIRLQHIADEVELSVGNIAYHYKNKDAILEAIYVQLENDQKLLLAELKIVPLFVNINAHILNTFQLQKKYAFFYSDTFEVLRSFPIIKYNYRRYTEWFVSQIQTMLEFNVARGAFIPASTPDTYSNLAVHYWMTIELWLYQNRIRGLETLTETTYAAAAWSLLIPYFTEIGHSEYRQMNDLKNYNWL